MILVIARSGPVKIDFERLEEEVSGRGRGQKIMTAVWKEFFFLFFSSPSISGLKFLRG